MPFASAAAVGRSVGRPMWRRPAAVRPFYSDAARAKERQDQGLAGLLSHSSQFSYLGIKNLEYATNLYLREFIS